MNNIIETVIVKTYDGTIESLHELVIGLSLKMNEYSFCDSTRRIFIHTNGIMYQPGDCYLIKSEPKEYKVIR